MILRDAAALVRQNIGRNPKHYLFASVGIVVGVAMLSFFVALGVGVHERVLNTYFPVNQVELEPQHIGVFGVQEALPSTEVTADRLAALRKVPGVVGVYPKQRSRFQALLWGGRNVFGFNARAEAFFDGIAPALVREELQRRERRHADPAEPHALAGRRELPCDVHGDCPVGFDCTERRCLRHPYWSDFQVFATALPCDDDRGCAPGQTCHLGRCRPGCGPAVEGEGAPLCAGGARYRRCEADEDCPRGQGCQGLPCEGNADCPEDHTCRARRCRARATGAELRVCDLLSCRLRERGDQVREDPVLLAGRVERSCPPGAAADDPACAPQICPEGTYCAARNVDTAEGLCQPPLPILLNPLLVDVFNATAASALHLPRVSDPRVLLGLPFFMRFGDSFFVKDERRDLQVNRRARIVGFTDKAPMLGVTLPLGLVQAYNARFRGRASAERFDSVIAVTGRNEELSAVIPAAGKLQLTLGPSSREARKLSNMLMILTLVFGFISLVIMGIAAVNIAHTFLMMVAERRTEIGVMRALGATRNDVRLLILLEAAFVGLVGGVAGHCLAFGASRAANALAREALRGVLVPPEDFFVFDPLWLGLMTAGAVLFAVAGALAAARKAARLDPAVVLTSA